MRSALRHVKNLDNFVDADCEPPHNSDDVLAGDIEGSFVERYLKGEQCIAFRRAEKFSASETVQDGFIIYALKGRGSADLHAGGSEHEAADHVGIGGKQP